MSTNGPQSFRAIEAQKGTVRNAAVSGDDIVNRDAMVAYVGGQAGPVSHMHFFNANTTTTNGRYIGNGLAAGLFNIGARQILPYDAMVTKIYATHRVAPGDGQTYTFELRNNTTPTTVSVVATGAVDTAVSVATGFSEVFPAGTELTVWIDYSAGANNTGNYFSIMIDLIPQ